MSPVPDHCRAAVLAAYGEPLQVVDVPVPAELEPGALLVRTRAATVCATDLHFAHGPVAGGYSPSNLPVILGHEMTGTVVAFGAGAERDSVGQPLSLGDRIIWSHGFCGRCEACVVQREPVLCTSLRAYMRGNVDEYPHLTGGFSEYVYVFPTSGRVKVPDSVSDVVASASSCALRTVVHGFERLGTIDDGQSVVVLGTGPLGLFAVAKAATTAAGPVIAVGGPEARLDLARAWGADHVLDVATTDAGTRVQAVRDLTGGRGADIVFELSGVPAAFGQGLEMLRRGGRYVVIGQLHTDQVPFNPSQIVTKQATIIGSISATIEHYWKGLQFLERHAGRFDWDSMISGRYGLDEINVAMERMRTWDEIKPAIVFETADGGPR